MKLESVTLENFRQYAGKQKPLRFSTASDKNVTIIHGVNGSGKSNLFKAINWCMYGDDALDDKKAELTSKKVIADKEPGDVITTSVHLALTHRSRRYLIARSREYLVEKDGKGHYQNDDFMVMRNTGSGKSESIKNKVGEINSILPEKARTYFLFDGEKIDNFSKPESSEDIRNAIYNVLKLELLTRGRKHLDAIATEYRQELKAIASGDLKKLLDAFEKMKTEKDKLEDNQQELNQEITLAKQKIENIDKQLRSMKEAKELQNQRKALESEKDSKNEEYDENILKIQKLSTASSRLIGAEIIEKTAEILEQKRIKGEIPSNIRFQFLQDIIDKKVCICGRHFVENSKEHRNLAKLQTGTVSGNVEEEVLNLNASLNTLKVQIDNDVAELQTRMTTKSQLEDEIDGLDEQINELHKKLKGSRQEDIQKLEERREEYKDDIDEYMMKMGRNAEKLENLSNELDKKTKEIDKAEKDQARQKNLSQKMKLAQTTADAINDIYQDFADEMRKEIEAKTKEIFQQLIWKESQFKDLKLTNDYSLEVIDRWKKPASPELSAGERQVLSLSFIAAMAEGTGEEAPIVMDTPFGRLSTRHREKITETIPNLAKIQLVLFVTDEEMTGKMDANLKPKVGARYHLNFDDAIGCTTIEDAQ